MRRLLFVICSCFCLLGQPLSIQAGHGQTLRNLTALAHLAGYVDYFYPREPIDTYTMETLVACYASYIEGAENDTELIDRLNEAFADRAMLVHVYPTGDVVDIPSDLLTPPDDATHITKKVHYAVSSPARPFYITPPDMLYIGLDEQSVEYIPSHPGYEFLAEPIIVERPNAAAPYTIELVGGVSARVPLALYADSSGTFPREQPIYFFECPFETQDRSRNVSVVIGAYNAMKFYFPYWDTVDLDWEDSLATALADAMASSTTSEGHRIVNQMMVPLNDGHIFVPYTPTSGLSASLPINWDIVDNQLIITGVFDDLPLERGDIVLSIDGQPALEVVEAIIEMRSGSPQYRRYQALRILLQGGQTQTVDLEVMNQHGETATIQLMHTYSGSPFWEPHEVRPDVVAELGEGIVYVDMTRLTFPILDEMTDTIMNADGLVLDMRGYPLNHAPIQLMTSFTDQTLQNIITVHPVRISPEELRFYEYDFPFPYSSDGQRFEGVLAWLTAGYTVSQAEAIIGLAERNNFGVFVGQTTAGANGNLASLNFAGVNVSWSSVRVLKADGSPINNNGFVPDIPVEPTLEDIRLGRDVVLEAAVDYLTNGN